MSSGKNEFLKALKVNAEEAALKLHSDGNPLAAISLMKGPWITEQVGVPVKSGKRLEKLEKSAVSGHSRISYAGGEAFRWINGLHDIQHQFRQRLMLSNGSTFDAFLDACWPVFDAIQDFHTSNDPDWTFEAHGDVMRLTRFLPKEVSEDLNRAARCVDRLCELLELEAWPRALAEGTVLLFRDDGDGFEFLAPHRLLNEVSIAFDFSIHDIWSELQSRQREPTPDGSASLGANTRELMKKIGIRGSDYGHLLSPVDVAPMRHDTSSMDSGPALLAMTGRPANIHKTKWTGLFSADLPRTIFRPGAPPPSRADLNNVREARMWFREKTLEIWCKGLRPSAGDTKSALSKRFGISKDFAEEIWRSQRPEKWSSHGRIPDDQRYFF